MKNLLNVINSLAAILIFIVTFSFLSGCDITSTKTTPLDNADLSSFSTSTVTDLTDSLKIDTAKIYLKDIKLNVAGSNDSANFRTDPIVMFLNLSNNVNLMTTTQVIPGYYDKIKFEIHKVEDSETPIDPEFVDSSGRYSTIVKGYFNGSYFVFKSPASAHQKLNFPTSIFLSSRSKTNFTLKAEPYKWFYKNGVLMNPTDPANQNDISNNIKNNINDNIKAFRDNDRNGIAD